MPSTLPPPRRHPLTSTLPPGLDEIDASWSEEESPTLDDGDPSERVTQIPEIPPDQFARQLMEEAAAEPSSVSTMAASPPSWPPAEDDLFERPTLVDPLEALTAPPPPRPLAEAPAPVHPAISPAVPRVEPHHVRGISDLPPVLRPQNTRPTEPPDSDEFDPLTGRPTPLDFSHETANAFAGSGAYSSTERGSGKHAGLHNTSYSRAEAPVLETTTVGRRPSGTLRGLPSSLELDLDHGPGGAFKEPALESAVHALHAPALSGLELAQRFSSLPPPSSNPMRDMKDRYAMGDFSGALTVAEKILEGSPHDREATRCAQSCRDVLGDMYASRIGDLEQSLVVIMSPEQIRWLSLDHRAGFLLSMVDGMSTVDELLDVCGMQRLDALRIICNLMDQRVVSLRR